MEERCSFSKLVGGPCGLHNRYPLNKDITQLVSCKKDITRHTNNLGVTDISTEIDLILARASLFFQHAKKTRMFESKNLN